MRHFIAAGFVLAFVVFTARAQSSEARLLDSFTVIPCGHMMAVLDGVLAEWRASPDNWLVVVYRGHRYRKHRKMETNGAETIILRPAHPDDGLNWAKGIPKYLISAMTVWQREGELELLRKRLSLVDAGYDEEMSAEIWLVPPGKELPAHVPKLKRADIKFGARQPYKVPSYFTCYAMYERGL